MKRSRWVMVVISVALMVVAWAQIWLAQQGLKVRHLNPNQTPMIFMAPKQAEAQPVPGVLIAHGFSGSKQLMLGYGHVLAQSGYGVLLWDRTGHGTNPVVMEALGSESFESEEAGFQTAWETLKAQPEVDGDRLALLGHSLGGGTVLRAGVEYPEDFQATIAISSIPAPVDATRPRNLQLQVGALEPGMIQQNAQKVLSAAGGDNEQLQEGLGRTLLTIPKVEHSTILFADRSHEAARDWLDRVFAPADASREVAVLEKGSTYRDRRMVWYLLHLLGGLGGLAAVAPLLAIAKVDPVKPKSTWLGLIAAPVVAGAGLLELSRHIELATLGGIQVGGAVSLWFLIAGITWLGFVGRVSGLALRNLGIGWVLFAMLWVAFGLMAHWVWLPWFLIPARFQIWPLLALGCLPWFLAAGMVQQHSGIGRRLLIWLVQSLVLMVGFGLAAYFVPSLFFMLLLLPFFPLVIGILSWAAAFYDDVWVGAIASSLFFGWILAALFPLA